MKRILFFYLILTIIIGTPISWYAWPKSLPHQMSPSDMRLYYRGFGFNDGTGIFGRRWYAVTFDPEHDGSHWQFKFIDSGYNPYKAFYSDGSLQQEGKCRIEIMGLEYAPYPNWSDLEWAKCYRPDGSLGSKIVDGTGTQTQWMQDGTKVWELELVDYERVAHTRWYPNGQLRTHQAYVNGEVHGPFISYYPSGAKQTEGAYDAGRRVGTWIRYNEDGSVESTESN